MVEHSVWGGGEKKTKKLKNSITKCILFRFNLAGLVWKLEGSENTFKFFEWFKLMWKCNTTTNQTLTTQTLIKNWILMETNWNENNVTFSFIHSTAEQDLLFSISGWLTQRGTENKLLSFRIKLKILRFEELRPKTNGNRQISICGCGELEMNFQTKLPKLLCDDE